MFPIKQVRSPDLLDGSTESSPEIPHKQKTASITTLKAETVCPTASSRERISVIVRTGLFIAV